ncbi:hypothetical protein PV11_04472 [Exophiala sideris]|uniref:DUF1330 domain-containing protein n=1 Tax=Exophiala sideris TaxID=1016849 RepID=A0A0D1Z651_9EURO|nr:hypothetical protein PV11_04472 [Exophiala sideris]
MSVTEIQVTDLSVAAKGIPEDTPVVMVNLLRFKTETTYPKHLDHAPSTGREAYLGRYVPAWSAICASVAGSDDAIKPLFLGKPHASLLAGPFGAEMWDVVGVITYPSFRAFREVLESKQYQDTALPHRLASLEDWRLYATTELKL